MRIAVIHNLVRGGAHRRLSAHLEHMGGHELVEICPSSAQPITEQARVIELRGRADDRARWRRPFWRYVDQRELERTWRQVAEEIAKVDVDVVYANPCRYQQAPLALLSGSFRSVYFCDEPRRVDHEFEAMSSRSNTTRPLYGPLYSRQRQLDTRAAALASLLATNSSYTQQQIRTAYERDSTVIGLGVADQFLADQDERARDIVLSVGTLIPSKGHDLVVAAAGTAQTRRRVIVVAPRSDGVEARRLHDLATQNGVELEIRIGITDSELHALYLRSFATLYLARSEPFGLVSLESQACRAPVIVANEGGLPETVRDGVTGFVVPRDVAAVAARLDQLEDNRVHQRLSRAAREFAVSRTWAASAAEMLRLLESVCFDQAIDDVEEPRAAA